jgi:hypothetical protein
VCHRLDLCSSAAAKTLPSSTEQFLQDIYNHFSRSAKRKFRFKHHQELCGALGHTILRHSNTRWLSLSHKVIFHFLYSIKIIDSLIYACVDRILEQWVPFGEYFAQAVQGNKETTTANIFHALSKPIFRLHLAFLSYILDIMCKINMEFQAEKPKIHKLHNKMVSFYKILLWNYLKRNYVNSTNIDIVNPKHLNNYLSIEDIYLGPKAQLIIENESHLIPTSDTACYGNAFRKFKR